MICTYITAFILLFLKFSDAMKEEFNPDTFMQSLMFKDNTKIEKPEQRPSVFGAKWGFSIHNPSQYQNQYGTGKAYSSFNIFGPDSFQVSGTINFKAHSNLLNPHHHVSGGTNSNSNSDKGLAMKSSKDVGKVVGYQFNPTLLNQKLMQIPSRHSYKLNEPKQGNYDNSENGLINQINGTSGQTGKEQNSEINSDLSKKTLENNKSNKNKKLSGVNSEKKAMLKFGYNPTQLNKQMMGGVHNMFNNDKMFNDHTLIGTQKQKHSSKDRNSFHFDPTTLNSKMLTSVGYNPSYVNSLTSSSARHKRSSNDFDPNAMMNRYMELRTNIDSFGSYHPNDMISSIMLLFGRNKQNGGPASFDPNGKNMLSTTQRWGLKIYNPLHSLDQYNGKNIGRGSSGPNPNTVLSGFNPNILNGHLMTTLSQNGGHLSTSNYYNTEFNSNYLNNNLFGGLSFNPAVVNMKTILPIVHENIPTKLLTSQQNRTNESELPKLEHVQGNNKKMSSTGLENGYVKNTHSHSNINGIIPENTGKTQKVNSQKTNGTSELTSNAHLLSNENLNIGHLNINNGEAFLQTTKPNMNVAQNFPGNNMFNSNSEKGSTNLGHTQVTGLEAIAETIHPNGNGYQQALIQQGPTQGIINNTSILNGSGGTVTQPQTQAGGPGSTIIHQNMIQSGNGLSTSMSLGKGKSSNNTHPSEGGLGSTMGKHFKPGAFSSQGIPQTNPGMGNSIATQTATENIGSNFIPQTGAGGLGYYSVSQSITDSRRHNKTTHVETGEGGDNTVFQTNAGGLGSSSVSQTDAGSLGSTNGSGYSAANSMTAGSVSQTGTNVLGSNSVTQSNNGDLGPKTVSQSAAGSLGSSTAAQTNAKRMDAYILSQTAAGGLGSTSVSQSGSGSLGSNSGMQTNEGRFRSNTISQTASGKLGLNTETQTDAELRSNKASKIQLHGSGEYQSDGERLEPYT